MAISKVGVVGCGLMGHGIMTWVHRYLDVTVTSTLTLANPVISTIGAWLVKPLPSSGP